MSCCGSKGRVREKAGKVGLLWPSLRNTVALAAVLYWCRHTAESLEMRVHIRLSRALAAIPLLGLWAFGASMGDTPVASTPPPSAAPAKPQPKLNLKVPDVNRTLTPGERRAAMGPNDTDKANETVEVQRQRAGDAAGPAKPPGGIASVFWAFAHPVSAWRIFFPVPPEQRGNDEAPRNN